MTDAERRENARQFYQKWNGRGKEDEDDRSYWIDFLQNVLGVDHVTDRIEFQKKVIGPDGNTKRIDAYIPETGVLIEQKSIKIDLAKPQASHNGMTPYEQAKMYDNALPHSEKARWIVLSNFNEIWVYDMEERKPEPLKFYLNEIQTKYSQFEFLVNKEQKKISREMEVSVKAGEFVGLLYDALYKQYIDPENEESLKSLNMLCVRLVFCLYAEDAHIFGSNGHMFHDYLDQFQTRDLRKALIELFKVLDTPEDKRDKYDTSDLSKFPYVNGGLFEKEDLEIPQFTDEIRDILLNQASAGFDWSQISPTIFGAVFESTLNPETRRSGGMHYTSIENIHKVIDPLFLDELKEEFDTINAIQIERTKKQKLEVFQNKLADLKWLDPACGSGNFLTETYLSIRRLENKVIRAIKDCDRKQVDGQISFTGTGVTNPIKVSISQFYGIEINDFAVTVAKTALWIAESQMMKETEDMIKINLDFLPLKTNAYIVEGNALRIDWNEVCPKNELDFIMGNPPFHGFTFMTDNQKRDMDSLFSNVKNLDYVCAWYKKASDYIRKTDIEVAFVSTNSIVQGETVARFWDFLPDDIINFAYTTFVWDSEATQKAKVHCVIIGFSKRSRDKKLIFDKEPKLARNINRYLMDGDNIVVRSRNTPICSVPRMIYGNKPADGGNLIIEESEYESFVKEDPQSIKYIKPLLGATEYINGKRRWCLWLVDAKPNEIRNCPLVMKRIEQCKKMREASIAEGIRKFAQTPSLFAQRTQPTDKDFIIVPRVSSQNRRYIPMGFIKAGTIVTDRVQIIPDATLYEFGIIISNVHMSWTRVTCMRLKSDYSYSKDIVYNNYPWPQATNDQKMKIAETAQGIIDARQLYADSSLADLYDPLTMPPELQKAHSANDRAVMQAYGFDIKNMSEADCVAALMKMYQELVNHKK